MSGEAVAVTLRQYAGAEALRSIAGILTETSEGVVTRFLDQALEPAFWEAMAPAQHNYPLIDWQGGHFRVRVGRRSLARIIHRELNPVVAIVV
jgi:hypothetical protein